MKVIPETKFDIYVFTTKGMGCESRWW